MIDFDVTNLKYMGMEIPRHTQDTIRNYLIRGWAPGGFAESMLAHDYDRALYCADTGNRQMFWAIAVWFREELPSEAQGSYNAFEKWRDDLMGRRTAFVTDLEKEMIWKVLSS